MPTDDQMPRKTAGFSPCRRPNDIPAIYDNKELFTTKQDNSVSRLAAVALKIPPQVPKTTELLGMIFCGCIETRRQGLGELTRLRAWMQTPLHRRFASPPPTRKVFRHQLFQSCRRRLVKLTGNATLDVIDLTGNIKFPSATASVGKMRRFFLFRLENDRKNAKLFYQTGGQ